jgi:D-aminoacyl-tRNA deacylase
VAVDDEVVGSIGLGLLALVGVHRDDTEAQADWLAAKMAGLRIFPDEDENMNRSVTEVGGSVLVVSQFTLYGDARKGRRPSFVEAAKPPGAEALVGRVAEKLREEGIGVAEGVFGAHMEVRLVNDGPVTLMIESPA